MNLKDATDAETLNKTELKQLEFNLQERKAEKAWEESEITKFDAVLNGNGSDDDKENARLQKKDAQARLDEHNTAITNGETRKTELATEATEIKTRQDTAAAYLA